MSHYDTNLDKNEANYVPLSPLTFLERTNCLLYTSDAADE